jgi:aquaporin Z
MGQLWLFWLAPIAGALLAGWVYRNLLEERPV